MWRELEICIRLWLRNFKSTYTHTYIQLGCKCRQSIFAPPRLKALNRSGPKNLCTVELLVDLFAYAKHVYIAQWIFQCFSHKHRSIDTSKQPSTQMCGDGEMMLIILLNNNKKKNPVMSRTTLTQARLPRMPADRTKSVLVLLPPVLCFNFPFFLSSQHTQPDPGSKQSTAQHSRSLYLVARFDWIRMHFWSTEHPAWVLCLPHLRARISQSEKSW